MRFPNAYKGVKKLYLAALIELIISILSVLASVLVAIDQETMGDLSKVAAGILLFDSFALIVAFILNLVGLYQGGNDEPIIKKAFNFAIAGIIVSLIASMFTAFETIEILVIIGRYLNILVSVFSVVVLVYTFKGIASLADKLGEKWMAIKGRSLSFIVTVLYISSIVLNLLARIFEKTEVRWLAIIILVGAIVASIAQLVVWLLSFFYYKKATKMLE